jgi:hypothetical protein
MTRFRRQTKDFSSPPTERLASRILSRTQSEYNDQPRVVKMIVARSHCLLGCVRPRFVDSSQQGHVQVSSATTVDAALSSCVWQCHLASA